MRLRFGFVLILLILVTLLSAEDLRICGIQLEITDRTAMIRSEYETMITQYLGEALTSDPDCIVFPEYLSVFPYLFFISDAIPSESEWASGVLRRYSGEVQQYLQEFWGGLARQHQISLVAGTTFILDGGKLYNRLLLFDENGESVYTQNKVYLTPFEREIGLSRGLREEARPVEIAGNLVVFTICRDTFFDAWNPLMDEADFWVDIKANGVVFTEEQQRLFALALPERIRETQVPAGMTVCLTGSCGDFLWQGESSVVTDRNGSLEYLERAIDPIRSQVLSYGF